MNHDTERDRANAALSAPQTLQNIQIADSRDVQVIGHADIHVGEQAQDVRGLPSPYLGLRSFDYADKNLYAGHAASIEAAVRLLTTPRHERTLLFITGASGSGKSSFARAGLIPALEGSYQQRNLPVRYAICTPSRYPLENMGAALHRLGRAARGPFSAVAPHMPDWPHEPAGAQQISLLVIDQFEELFTQSEPDQGDALIELLGTLPRFGVLRMHLIATLRVDYLPALFAYQTLYDIAKQGIDLRAMSEVELKVAIQRPLQTIDALKGKRFATDLLDRLARDTASDAAYLPLLQVTLDDVWRRGTLTAGAYQTLTDAIQQRAEQVYAYGDYDGARQQPRSSAEQAALLQLFLDLVEVSLDDDARRDVRHRRRIADLVEGTPARRRLIDDLCAARLLSAAVEHHDGVSTEVVDIIHETLIASWPRLQTAIADQRDRLRRRARFEQALAEWRRNGRTDVYLLGGIQLAEAQALDRARDVALRGVDAQEFLKRGEAQRERQRHRQLRSAWSVAVALGILLVAALSAAWWANTQTTEVRKAANQRATAEAQAHNQLTLAQTAQAQTSYQLNRSIAQRLAFAAQSQHDAPETALLLAYEAAAHDDNSVTSQALRDAIDQASWRPTVLIGHTSFVYHAVFSPDGSRILTASADGTARLWDLNGRSLAILQGHSNQLLSAVFSPDGSRILTASYDSTARLWDITGQPLATFRGTAPRSAVFSPDGSRILTASYDGTIRLWDTSGRMLGTFQTPRSDFPNVVFSPDGARIIVTWGDYMAGLWDIQGHWIATFGGKAATPTPTASAASNAGGSSIPIISPVARAAASLDGLYIVTTEIDGSARLWDTQGRLLATLQGQHRGIINNVASSPDGSRILTVSDGTMQLWDTQGRLLATLQGHTASIFNPAKFSSDGSQLLSISDNNTVQVWDIQGQLLATLQGHTDRITSAVFSPDRQHILTASLDKTARVWDLSGQPLATLGEHIDAVAKAVFSPDGSRIATVSSSSTARLWDLNGLQLAILPRYIDPRVSVVFSPNGSGFLTASNDSVQLWDIQARFLATFQGSTNFVTCAIFSPDGSRILATWSDGSARLWDTQGHLLTTFHGADALPTPTSTGFTDLATPIMSPARKETTGVHTQPIRSAAFSPDGSRILTVLDDGTVQVWDVEGQQLAIFHRYDVGSTSAVFSPDSSRILTGSRDGTARLWDLKGQLLATLQGHTKEVTSIGFSPDGSRLLTGSQDGTARLWDVQGDLIATLQGHNDGVASAVFSPDGSRVLTASFDGTARLWDVQGQPLATLRGHTKFVYSAVFSPDGSRILTASYDGTARQYLVNTSDLLAVAACRIARGLTDDEIARFQVPRPLHFDFAHRRCPPVLK